MCSILFDLHAKSNCIGKGSLRSDLFPNIGLQCSAIEITSKVENMYLYLKVILLAKGPAIAYADERRMAFALKVTIATVHTFWRNELVKCL